MAALVHDRLKSEGTLAGRRDDHGAEHPQAAPAGSGAAAGGRTEERRRRPVLATIVVVGLMVAGGPVAGAVSSLAGGPAPTTSGATRNEFVVEGRMHVVQPGETYWSVAEELGGEGDIRARVDALEAANDGRSLQAGDRLAVPVLD